LTHVYEVRPRKDHRGFDLISDALPLVGCGTPERMRLRMQSATHTIAAVPIRAV